MSTRIVFLLLSSLFVMSCGDSNESKNESIELLSYKAPCFGVAQKLCLIEYDRSNASQSYFYDSIDGFDFVWGHRYQLSVKVTELSNPPTDGSSLKYELQQIVSDIEDAIGTNYEYELVELLDNTFTKDPDGKYYFLEQPFMCDASVDCDALVNLNDSGGLVNVTFEYSGNGEITLIQWN